MIALRGDLGTGLAMTATRTPRFRLQISKQNTVVPLADAALQVRAGEHPDAFKAVLIEAANAAFPQEATGFSPSERKDRS